MYICRSDSLTGGVSLSSISWAAGRKATASNTTVPKAINNTNERRRRIRSRSVPMLDRSGSPPDSPAAGTASLGESYCAGWAGSRAAAFTGRAASNHPQQHRGIYRFRQMTVETGLHGSLTILVLAVPGQRNQVDALESRIAPQAAGYRIAVHPRQADIENDDRRAKRGCHLERSVPVGSGAHLMA